MHIKGKQRDQDGNELSGRHIPVETAVSLDSKSGERLPLTMAI